MLNRRMEEKLNDRTCIDVRKIGKEIMPGVFHLVDFIPDVDYCDAEKEAWIGSIGVDKDGQVLASTDARFYLAEDYRCIWLR